MIKIKAQSFIDDKCGRITFHKGKKFNRLSIGFRDFWFDKSGNRVKESMKAEDLEYEFESLKSCN